MRLPRVLFIVLVSLLLLAVAVAPALAQVLEPTPEPEPGICAPWHRCIAFGAIGMAAIAVLLFGVGYLVQSRGFHKLEHKQGNPEGVPAKRD
jgi:hypothetical protein